VTKLRVERGDITAQHVDAIVNAANEGLLGGGVDGAIHRAAGPELLEACRRLPELSAGVRCPTGEARLTPGFGLKARFVIHTVGPVFRGGGHGERLLLASCYEGCLRLCVEHGLRSVAFPAISCGVYGFPIDEAARIAVATIQRALAGGVELDSVRLVAFDASVHEALAAAVAALRS
jgi:O-acetyl-ADP-ribose deacetylase (regulator of RNase III)